VFHLFFPPRFFSFHSNTYPAASSYYDTVQKIYIGYYQRPADPAGLIYWANDFLKYDLIDLIKPFASAPEPQSLYGTIDNNNIEIVINKKILIGS